MSDRYSSICGITEDEPYKYFEEDLRRMAAAQDMSYDEVCTEMRRSYDGREIIKVGVNFSKKIRSIEKRIVGC